MRGRRHPAGILLVVSVAMMVVSIVGLVGSILLSAFVFDRYNAYGEVPIPGSASLRLPAGEVAISFHTQLTGTTSGNGLPVPPLHLDIVAPDGVADPVLDKDFGATTTVNNDARRRVWTAHIAAEGSYRVTVDGQVNPFINPSLAFGRPSSLGWLPWVFGALLAVSVLDLVVAVFWRSRAAVATSDPSDGGWPGPGLNPAVSTDAEQPWVAPPYVPPSYPGAQNVAQPTGSYVPTDEAIRIEQIKNLAARWNERLAPID